MAEEEPLSAEERSRLYREMMGEGFVGAEQGYQATNLDELTFGDAWQETNWKKFVPFLASVDEGQGIYELYEASVALENGTDTQEQREMLAAMLQHQRRSTSLGYKFGSIVFQLPAFLGEFVATGGIATAGRQAVGLGLREAIEKSLAKQGKSLAVKGLSERAAHRQVKKEIKSMPLKELMKLAPKRGAGAAAEAATQLLAMEGASQALGGILPGFSATGRVENATWRRAMAGVDLTSDEAGNLGLLFYQHSREFMDALPEGIVESYIQVVSEKTGGAFKDLGRVLNKAPMISKLGAAQAKVAEWWIKKYPKKGPPGFINKVLQDPRSNWDGIIEEFMEERAATLMEAGVGATTDWQGFSTMADVWPGVEQSLAELVAFSVLPIGGAITAPKHGTTRGDEILKIVHEAKNKLTEEEAAAAVGELRGEIETGLGRPKLDAEGQPVLDEQGNVVYTEGEGFDEAELFNEGAAEFRRHATFQGTGARVQAEDLRPSQAKTDSQKDVEAMLRQRGVPVAWAETDEAMNFPAVFTGNGVVLSTHLSDNIGIHGVYAVAMHEAFHSLKVSDPEVWNKVVELVGQVEGGQEKMQAAIDSYLGKLSEAQAAALAGDQEALMDEAVANAVQELGPLLVMMSDPGGPAHSMVRDALRGTNRGPLKRLLDWIRDVLGGIYGGPEYVPAHTRRGMENLQKLLQETGVPEGMTVIDQASLELADIFKSAFDGMVTTEVTRRVEEAKKPKPDPLLLPEPPQPAMRVTPEGTALSPGDPGYEEGVPLEPEAAPEEPAEEPEPLVEPEPELPGWKKVGDKKWRSGSFLIRQDAPKEFVVIQGTTEVSDHETLAEARDFVEVLRRDQQQDEAGAARFAAAVRPEGDAPREVLGLPATMRRLRLLEEEIKMLISMEELKAYRFGDSFVLDLASVEALEEDFRYIPKTPEEVERERLGALEARLRRGQVAARKAAARSRLRRAYFATEGDTLKRQRLFPKRTLGELGGDPTKAEIKEAAKVEYGPFPRFAAALKEQDEARELDPRFATTPPNQPVASVRADAVSYAKKYGLPTPTVSDYVPVDPERGARIADEFERLAHAPESPEVLEAYGDLVREITQQYSHLIDRGATFTPWVGEGQPYANSQEMVEDILKNRRLFFFPTERGFGEEELGRHPMLADTGLTAVNSEGVEVPLLANDLFRAVHDWFGHAMSGYAFGPRGEENAWIEHAKMLQSSGAVQALTTETRGQNSWVNYGPHLRRADGTVPARGEEGYVSPVERPYADQKAGLLPPEVADPRFAAAPEGMKIDLTEVRESILENGGITVNVWTGGQPSTGYAVPPFKETELIIPRPVFSEDDMEQYLEKFRALLTVGGMNYGAWVEEGRIYQDVSLVLANELLARAIGRVGQQEAIFNLETFETLYDRDAEAAFGKELGKEVEKYRRSKLKNDLERAKRRILGAVQEPGEGPGPRPGDPARFAAAPEVEAFFGEDGRFAAAPVSTETVGEYTDPGDPFSEYVRVRSKPADMPAPAPIIETDLIGANLLDRNYSIVWDRGLHPDAQQEAALYPQTRVHSAGNVLPPKGRGYGTSHYINLLREAQKRDMAFMSDPIGTSPAVLRIYHRLQKAGVPFNTYTLPDGETQGYWVGSEDLAKVDLEAIRQGLEKTETVREPAEAKKPYWQRQLEAEGWDLDKEGRSVPGDPRFAAAPAPNTPEFRAWFKDSKVVDEAGRPLVVYHGTGAEFTEFKDLTKRVHPAYQGLGKHGSLHWFAASASYASGFAKRGLGFAPSETAVGGVGGRVIPAYVSLQNPYIDRFTGEEWKAPGMANERVEDFLLSEEGAEYDGYIRLDPQGKVKFVVARRSTQIKSSIGNIGTFDPAQADIRFAAAPTGVEDAPLVDSLGPKENRTWLQQNLTAQGNMDAETFRAKLTRDFEIDALMTEAAMLQRDLGRALRGLYGEDLGEKAMREVNAALAGELFIDQLHPDIRSEVFRMRNSLDRLSIKMIEIGAVDEKLIPTIEKNLGAYLHRSYKVFDDPNWLSTLPREERNELLNKATAWIRTEYEIEHGKMPTDAETEAILRQWLRPDAAEDTPVAMMAGGKLGRKDLSIFKRRKGIPPEIRALWGEYKDPMVNYTRSLAKMANIVANHKFLTDIRETGLRAGWLSEGPSATHSRQIKGDNMKPLKGLYAEEDMHKTLTELYEAQVRSTAARMWYGLQGTAKFSKTVLSLMTHVRNLTGNIGFAMANGHWRVWHVKDALPTAAIQLFKGGTAERRELYLRLQRLGVVGQSTHQNELEGLLRDASRQGVAGMYEGGIRKKARQAFEGVTALYGAEDDVWKVYAFFNERARYAERMPELSEQELDEKVAEIVRNTYPTYSMVPKVIQGLRRNPLVGTFVSFPWEVLRTSMHTAKLIAKELGDPNLRPIGMQRAVGALAAGGSTYALALAARAALGLDADDDDDMRRFLPPWQVNSQLVPMGYDDKGNLKFMDISYTDPYSYLRKPVIAAMRGEDITSASVDAMLESLAPFFGEEILAGAGFDIARNTKRTGGQVYNPADDPEDIAADIIAHIYKAIEPGTLVSMRRIDKGLTNHVESYGRTYDAEVEAMALYTGVRVQTMDPSQGLYWSVRKFNDKRSDATRILTQKMRNKGAVPEDEVREAYRTMETNSSRLFFEIIEDVSAARRMGMNEQQIRAQLQAAGMPRSLAARAVHGRYLPWTPSKNMVSSILKSADTDEQRREFSRRIVLVRQLIAAERQQRAQQQTQPQN